MHDLQAYDCKTSLTRTDSKTEKNKQDAITELFSSPFAAGKTCIPVEDLISISVQKQRNSSTSSQVFPVLDATSPSLNPHDPISNEEFTFKSFTINYASRLFDPQCEQGSGANTCGDINKWRIHNVTLFNDDKMIVKEWYDTLSKLLNGKRLQVYLNAIQSPMLLMF